MHIDRTIGMFMDYCVSKQLRPRTLIGYEQAVKLFAAWLEREQGITRVEEINEATIRSYIRELKTRGKYTFTADVLTEGSNFPNRRGDYREPLTNTTVNNYLRNLKVYFNWLVESECISKSPVAKVKEVPNERKPREYLEDDEVKSLLKSLDTTYYPEYRDLLVIMVMLDSGTRLGETLSIEIDQLNLVNHSIVLPAEKTKGRRERTVYFSSRTANELRRWLQFKDRYCESDLVFPVKHHGGMMKIRNFEANFRSYMERIGITKQVSPHTLRNNFAKRCLLAGMDIFTLSRLLGHTSVEITEKAYLDVTDKELKKQYTRFSPLERIYR